MKRPILTVCLSVIALGFAFIAGTAFGQQAPKGRTSPPAQAEGRTALQPLASIDLGPELGFDGYELMVGIQNFDPGGANTMHSHKGTPRIVHILQGTLTEHRADGTVKDWKPGESLALGKEAPH